MRSGYEWVHSKVREKFSYFQSNADLWSFANSVTILEISSADDIVNVKCCDFNENVSHGRKGSFDDFFYYYACFITDSHVKFPLDDVMMDVIQILNVVSTQLHPNNWQALQAFWLACKMLNLKATTQNFIYFYSTRPGSKVT